MNACVYESMPAVLTFRRDFGERRCGRTIAFSGLPVQIVDRRDNLATVDGEALFFSPFLPRQMTSGKIVAAIMSDNGFATCDIG